MTIPRNKQKDFLRWFKEVSGPILGGFGAEKHELHKVEEKQVIGRQFVEKDCFIERIYFDNKFNIPDYFKAVKENPKACKLSKKYEEEFGAINIELRILNPVA